MKSLDQWREFARRDDCLDCMVPSDLRQLIGLLDSLLKAGEPLERVMAPINYMEGAFSPGQMLNLTAYKDAAARARAGTR